MSFEPQKKYDELELTERDNAERERRAQKAAAERRLSPARVGNVERRLED